MIKTGDQHLNQLKDGRVVYIGDEKINDVTTHPAFKNAAKTVGKLYDIKHQNKYKTKGIGQRQAHRQSQISTKPTQKP